MFGTSPAEYDPRGAPSSSMAAPPSAAPWQNFNGVTPLPDGMAGSGPPPTHDHGSDRSKISVSFEPTALQTVTSLSARFNVFAASGILPAAISGASFGSSTMIAPYRPFHTWFVDEWWCG